MVLCRRHSRLWRPDPVNLMNNLYTTVCFFRYPVNGKNASLASTPPIRPFQSAVRPGRQRPEVRVHASLCHVPPSTHMARISNQYRTDTQASPGYSEPGLRSSHDSNYSDNMIATYSHLPLEVCAFSILKRLCTSAGNPRYSFSAEYRWRTPWALCPPPATTRYRPTFKDHSTTTKLLYSK